MKFHQGNREGGDGNEELTGGKGVEVSIVVLVIIK